MTDTMQRTRIACAVKGCRNNAERLPNGLEVCFRHRTGKLTITRADGDELLVVDGKARGIRKKVRS